MTALDESMDNYYTRDPRVRFGTALTWSFVRTRTEDDRKMHLDIALSVLADDSDPRVKFAAVFTVAQYATNSGLGENTERYVQQILVEYKSESQRVQAEFPELTQIKDRFAKLRKRKFPHLKDWI